jgi:hypothetical protein
MDVRSQCKNWRWPCSSSENQSSGVVVTAVVATPGSGSLSVGVIARMAQRGLKASGAGVRFENRQLVAQSSEPGSTPQLIRRSKVHQQLRGRWRWF